MLVFAQRKKIVVLFYVDNCMPFCEDDNVLQETIKKLKKNFALQEQDLGKDVFACWGIELPMEGTKVTMHQDGLMKRIFKTTKWTELSGD